MPSDTLSLAILVIICFYGVFLHADDKVHENIRTSILAGSWYPDNRDALQTSINDYIAHAETSHVDGQIKALIVPHAGHIYSGPVAAYGYKLLKGIHVKRVIMIGPSHRTPFQGISVDLQTAYETPLGRVPVDIETAKKIIQTDSSIKFIKEAHNSEHSLEIQLPFLQTVLKEFSIIPVLMGQQDYGTCSKLASILVKIIGNSNDTIILASSDLSHYHEYSEAVTLDNRVIGFVKAMDPKGMWESLSSGSPEACGGGPVITTLLACRNMGANKSEILRHANSGDITGDRNRVVGYMSAVILKNP